MEQELVNRQIQETLRESGSLLARSDEMTHLLVTVCPNMVRDIVNTETDQISGRKLKFVGVLLGMHAVTFSTDGKYDSVKSIKESISLFSIFDDPEGEKELTIRVSMNVLASAESVEDRETVTSRLKSVLLETYDEYHELNEQNKFKPAYRDMS